MSSTKLKKVASHTAPIVPKSF